MKFPEPMIPVDTNGLGDAKMLCPVCRDSSIHIERLSYAAGDYTPAGVEVTPHALRWDRIVPCQGRGDRIFIEFWGECGHRFGLLLQHHQGETFLYQIDPVDPANEN